MKQNLKNQGQVVLMVVLTMLVGLTIATGIFLNSLSDTQLTTTEENSERAFNAAEAGIEDLVKDVDTNFNFGADTVIDVGSEKATVVADELNTFDFIVKQNSVATLFLDTTPKPTKVTIYWTDKSDPEQYPGTCNEGDGGAAGLIIQKWQNNGSAVTTEAYSPFDCSLANINFNSSNDGSTESFRSQITLSIDANDSFYRIRPVYSQARIKIVSSEGGDLPAQQYVITSTTKADSGETRAIEVTKTRPSLPEIFDYALFSGDTLVK